MAYKINAKCIACGACAATCPIEAIKEGEPIYVIGEECLECGACATVCSVKAIQV